MRTESQSGAYSFRIRTVFMRRQIWVERFRRSSSLQDELWWLCSLTFDGAPSSGRHVSVSHSVYAGHHRPLLVRHLHTGEFCSGLCERCVKVSDFYIKMSENNSTFFLHVVALCSYIILNISNKFFLVVTVNFIWSSVDSEREEGTRRNVTRRKLWNI